MFPLRCLLFSLTGHLISTAVPLKLQCAWESPGDLVTVQTPHSEGLGWCLRFCISNKFPDDADAGATFHDPNFM